MINEFSGQVFAFNTTLRIAVPQIEMVPTTIALPGGASHTVLAPSFGAPLIENRSQPVEQTGEEVLDRMGFHSTIERSVLNLLIWYFIGLAMAMICLALRIHGAACRRACKRTRAADAPTGQARTADVMMSP